MNLLVEVAECSVGMLRKGFGLVPPSFPGPKFQQMVIGRAIGFFSGNFRNYRF